MPDDRSLTQRELEDALRQTELHITGAVAELRREVNLRIDDLDRKIDGVRIDLLERMRTLSHNMNQRFDDLEKLPRAARRS